MTPIFLVHIYSSWVEISLHAKFQLPSMSGSGSFMVGDKNKNNLAKLDDGLDESPTVMVKTR